MNLMLYQKGTTHFKSFSHIPSNGKLNISLQRKTFAYSNICFDKRYTFSILAYLSTFLLCTLYRSKVLSPLNYSIKQCLEFALKAYN